MAHNHLGPIRSGSRELHGFGPFFTRLEVIMKPTIRVLGSWPMFVVMAIWLAFYVAANLWPASSWLEVYSVNVGNTITNQPVPMIAKRDINRPFYGDWVVTVRRWEYNGWSIYCNSRGTNYYQPGATFPDKLTLSWWTETQCPLLSEGKYTLTTTWKIQPNLSFVPAKLVTVNSNIFEVAR